MLPFNAPRLPLDLRRKIMHYAIMVVTMAVAACSSLAVLPPTARRESQPYHNSALSGVAWVLELLTGHYDRIYTELGVHQYVFLELISVLREMGFDDSRSVTLEEQLAIFLYMSVTGLTIRHTGERFQRSNETIGRYFNKMITIFSSPEFYNQFVHFPTAAYHLPGNFRRNCKLWPYFNGAIGALDGTHFDAHVPAAERSVYRDRKGHLSQNTLFACSFDLRFLYSLTGWEGSANDARIWQDARSTNFTVPSGRYYLGDLGYPHCAEIIVPYRNVRYHLAEWARSGERPQNKEELFNLRHASARNVIERIFGVVKRKFRILLLPIEYSLETQARLPVALAALHNFIYSYDAPDHLAAEYNEDIGEDIDIDFNLDGETPAARRDRIAEQMWNNYLQVLAEREEDDIDEIPDYFEDDTPDANHEDSPDNL